MADKQLSALPAASTAIALTDLLLMSVNGNSRKVTPTQLASTLMSLIGMYSSISTAVTDLNTLTNAGFYRIMAVNSASGNGPVGNATTFVIHASVDANRAAQIALLTNTAILYWRTRSNTGDWLPWVKGLGSNLLQTALNDITAGALLSVGSFGLGGDALTVTDFDAVTVNGFYRGLTGSTGTPNPGTNGWVIEHINYGSGASAQVAYRTIGTTTGAHYVRTRVGGVWGAWETTYSSGNILGTVSMAGGVPTGAIIQSGSNSNGSYLKFASGDMICATSDRTVAAVSSADGALFKSANLVWTYPSAFITPPVLMPGGVDDLDCIVNTRLPTSATVGVAQIKSTVSKATAITFGLVARGRWIA